MKDPTKENPEPKEALPAKEGWSHFKDGKNEVLLKPEKVDKPKGN